jgi:hypothetical protein
MRDREEMSSMGEEEFVSIMVPKDRVLDVYRYLTQGSLLPDATDPTAMSSVAISDEPVIDPAVVSRAYRESPPAMKQLFELLAAHPDEWRGIDEIRAEMGLKMHQLPGVLGAFQRRWKGRYKQAGKWPFDAEWTDATGSWTWRYRMPKANADLIRSLS